MNIKALACDKAYELICLFNEIDDNDFIMDIIDAIALNDVENLSDIREEAEDND